MSTEESEPIKDKETSTSPGSFNLQSMDALPRDLFVLDLLFSFGSPPKSNSLEGDSPEGNSPKPEP